MRQRAKRKRLTILLVPILLSMLLPSLALAGDDVEEQLKANYLDKVLTLRHFYEGEHLQFQPDGTLIGPAVVGPWTVDGQIAIKSIEVDGRVLRIRGRRVCLVFDDKAKTFRDVVTWLAQSKIKDRDTLEEYFRNKDVDVEIELRSEKPDPAGVSSAMSVVFLASWEPIRDFVPDFWHDYFYQLDGQPRIAPPSSEPVYLVKPGEVSPPRPTYEPTPELSEEARRAKYRGVVTMSLVVSSSGAVRDLAILAPLGLGLDEKAVESVSHWRFEPGTRKGKPVAVRIAVEANID